MKARRTAGAGQSITRPHLKRKFAFESLALISVAKISGPQHLDGGLYFLLGQSHLGNFYTPHCLTPLDIHIFPANESLGKAHPTDSFAAYFQIAIGLFIMLNQQKGRNLVNHLSFLKCFVQPRVE
jgi:hypothetical protein